MRRATQADVAYRWSPSARYHVEPFARRHPSAFASVRGERFVAAVGMRRDGVPARCVTDVLETCRMNHTKDSRQRGDRDCSE
jgi:hypothetical protein